MKCLYCGEETQNSNFCNKSCQGKYARSHVKNINKICLACGKLLINCNHKTKYCEDCKHEILSKQKKEEYAKHREKYLSRSKKYRTFNQEYYKEFNKEYSDLMRFGGNREKVLIRDEYTCQICGSKEKLVVHHIDGTGRGNEMHNNDLDNLITICRGCHAEIHKELLINSRIQ
jgi:5-methylcytosine-specific restriction endonuclease McrA